MAEKPRAPIPILKLFILPLYRFVSRRFLKAVQAAAKDSKCDSFVNYLYGLLVLRKYALLIYI